MTTLITAAKETKLARNSKQLFEFELLRFYFTEIFHQSNILVAKSSQGAFNEFDLWSYQKLNDNSFIKIFHFTVLL